MRSGSLSREPRPARSAVKTEAEGMGSPRFGYWLGLVVTHVARLHLTGSLDKGGAVVDDDRNGA
jgi:hypothetical protein